MNTFFRNGLLLFGILALITGCVKKHNTSKEPALPLQSYSVEGPFCWSTKESPRYDQISRPAQFIIAALNDFDDEIEHQLSVTKEQLFESIKTSSCEVQQWRQIYRNAGDDLFVYEQIMYRWKPEGCELKKTVGERKFSFHKRAQHMQSTSSRKLDSPFEVILKDNQYFLKTIPYEDLGCPGKDSILYVLTPLQNIQKKEEAGE